MCWDVRPYRSVPRGYEKGGHPAEPVAPFRVAQEVPAQDSAPQVACSRGSSITCSGGPPFNDLLRQDGNDDAVGRPGEQTDLVRRHENGRSLSLDFRHEEVQDPPTSTFRVQRSRDLVQPGFVASARAIATRCC